MYFPRDSYIEKASIPRATLMVINTKRIMITVIIITAAGINFSQKGGYCLFGCLVDLLFDIIYFSANWSSLDMNTIVRQDWIVRPLNLGNYITISGYCEVETRISSSVNIRRQGLPQFRVVFYLSGWISLTGSQSSIFPYSLISIENGFNLSGLDKPISTR